MQRNSKTEKFCHSILGLELGNSKPLANLVMGLASQQGAGSVTELSLSPCYHYQYSSISKVLSGKGAWGRAGPEELELPGNRLEVPKKWLLKQADLPKPLSRFWLFNTDITPVLRPYSESLPDRRYVYQPNSQVAGNKPVGIGYECSVVGLSARSPVYGGSAAAWNLPLSMRLVPFGENRNRFTAEQINELLDNADLPFHKELTVNALDSNYSSPEYIVDTHRQPHLVNLIRLASNRNVWKKRASQTQAHKRGAKAIYGQRYKLSAAPDWELPPDIRQEMGIRLANGKAVLVRLSIWEDMMLRSRRKKT